MLTSERWGSDDLSSALAKAAPTLTVTLLLDCLQQTMDFEAFLGGKKFGIPVCNLPRDYSAQLTNLL